MLQRGPLHIVPLNIRPEKEKGREAEDAQTAVSQILTFH